MLMTNGVKAAAIQMASGPNLDANLLEAKRLIREAAAGGAELIVLPENFAFMGQRCSEMVAVAEPEGEITGADVDRVLEAARAISLPTSLEIIHVIPRDYIVDSQGGIKDPVGMTGVRLEAEGHIITGSTTAIRNITKAVQELGINVNGLVFSGLASAYSTLSETEKELEEE